MSERAEADVRPAAAGKGRDPWDEESRHHGDGAAHATIIEASRPAGGAGRAGEATAGAGGDGAGDGAPGASPTDSSAAAPAAGDGPAGGAERPALQEDLTLLVTVLLGTPGEELTVVVGARCGEQPHARFARLTLPRAGWVESLFGGGEPAARGAEPATALAAYIADVSAARAERRARAGTARPASGQSSGQGAAGGRRQGGASTSARRRPVGGETPAGEAAADAGGTAALLARRKAGKSAAPAQGTPPTRRSLFDLGDDLS